MGESDDEAAVQAGQHAGQCRRRHPGQRDFQEGLEARGGQGRGAECHRCRQGLAGSAYRRRAAGRDLRGGQRRGGPSRRARHPVAHGHLARRGQQCENRKAAVTMTEPDTVRNEPRPNTSEPGIPDKPTGLAKGSTSSYVSAFMRAANAIYDVPEGRPAWKTLPIRLGVTLILMVVLVISAVIVVVTGGLARHVGQVLGIGPAAVTAWDIAKWPVLFILVCLMIAVLYWASPNARQGFRWISPGAVIAVVIWLIASGLFALYAANFDHYNKVYGSIAGMIIFLIWLWVSNTAILLGAEFNAELERGRAIAGGIPPDTEPFVEMRDTRKLRRGRRRAKKPAT